MSCISAYGDFTQFATLFAPCHQHAYCSAKNLPRVFTGTAPTLYALREAYGPVDAENWVQIQVRDISEFCGCREKLSLSQLDEIARVIISAYGHFKVSELMYFFLQFKSGKYGRFYGAVDGLVITEALASFARERIDILNRYEQEERERRAAAEAEERKGKTISRAQWERIKWKYGMTYDRCRRPMTRRRIAAPAFWHSHSLKQTTNHAKTRITP